MAIPIGTYLEGVSTKGSFSLKKIRPSMITLLTITFLIPGSIWIGLQYSTFLPGMEPEALLFMPTLGGAMFSYVFASKENAQYPVNVTSKS